MFQRKQSLFLLVVYTALRVFSFFFGPETPLQTQHIVNTIVSLALIALVAILIARGDKRGWYLILLEIILGGSGNYLAAFGLTVRTWFVIVAIPLYAFRLLWKKYWLNFWQRESKMVLLLGIFLTTIGLQTLHGYFNGHDLKLIIGDTLPYLYILYYFPLRELLRDGGFKQLALNALIAAIVGNALMIVGTFTGYSSGLLLLQDSYYHWYRDVAGGKITELPYHFYRLVLNEHLLLVPVFLYFLNKIIRKELAHIWLIFPALLLVILSINLTRIYLVALAVGLLALFNRAEWRRWFIGSLATLLFFGVAFTGTHLAASRGKSLGWEIFGIRLQSIVSPAIEDSSLSRLLLLPKILEKIKSNPILGTGIGDTVTVYSPVFRKDVTTPHFDWGYLEILAELGAVGLLVWVFIIAFLFRAYTKNQLPRWQLASFLALLTINLTSPALFHVLGILFLAMLFTRLENASAQ
ncbi:MAG: O-antigen ligase family protein [Candidatus Magasanikbacteria bacterium]|nr:O-antigen ligase family protein [Candidatus Magasanikbacteria bacterium]